MTKNVFEGAKFGDKFKVKAECINRPAIYLGVHKEDKDLHLLLIPNKIKGDSIKWYQDEYDCDPFSIENYYSNGECFTGNYFSAMDIVARWDESID